MRDQLAPLPDARYVGALPRNRERAFGYDLERRARLIGAAWGDRTTLHSAVSRIVRSPADWGAPKSAGAHGAYTGNAPLPAAPPALTLWLLETTLCASGARMPLHELLRSPTLFPFSIPISSGDLARSRRFQLDQPGQDLTMIHPADVAERLIDRVD